MLNYNLQPKYSRGKCLNNIVTLMQNNIYQKINIYYTVILILDK